MRNNYLLLFIAINIVFSGCKEQPKNKTSNVKDSVAKPAADTVRVAEQKDSLLYQLNREILATIKSKNYEKLSTYFHPESGVRFSPYGHIDTATDVVLKRNAFMQLIASARKIRWGSYDGSGEPIELTMQAYLLKFVYNADFLHAETISLNKPVKTGNTRNNISDLYKEADFIDNYFSGFEKKYEGMDWTALRLVFSKFEGKYYLIALVHDQWTI